MNVATIYIWRKKFDQLDTDEFKRLKDLEADNTCLKEMLIDRELETEAMNEITMLNLI